MAPVTLCGRDQTPPDRALGWTCTRQLGHEPPCAMVPLKLPWWKPDPNRPFMRWFDKRYRRFFT